MKRISSQKQWMEFSSKRIGYGFQSVCASRTGLQDTYIYVYTFANCPTPTPHWSLENPTPSVTTQRAGETGDRREGTLGEKQEGRGRFIKAEGDHGRRSSTLSVRKLKRIITQS